MYFFSLERIADRSRFYNLSNVGDDRLWLQNILLDNTDSDEPDDIVTEEDLQSMLKLHLYKKKCQKQFLAAKNVNLFVFNVIWPLSPHCFIVFTLEILPPEIGRQF